MIRNQSYLANIFCFTIKKEEWREVRGAGRGGNRSGGQRGSSTETFCKTVEYITSPLYTSLVSETVPPL